MNKKRFLLEGRDILKLAWPLLVAQITQMLMGVSDTIIAGRYSAVDMAAVALGFSISIPIMSFIQGIALAIPPLIARLQGAKSHDDVANATQQAGYLLLLVSIVPFWPCQPAAALKVALGCSCFRVEELHTLS